MTPLHRAIIEDHEIELGNRDLILKWLDIPDRLGYKPLEIAQLLGKYEIYRLLGGQLPEVLKLQSHGMKEPLNLSMKGFEKSLGICYRPFLTFSSYSLLKEVISQCPYILRSSVLASDNAEWSKMYHHEVMTGKTASIYVKWINQEMGYGVFAEKEIFAGTFIGEYTGIVRYLSRKHPDHNPYCFHYPTKWWSLKYFVIDALREGNLTRFINHSQRPNIHPLCLVDRGLLHQVFVASRLIKKGEQITFDYGKDYWLKRQCR